MKTFTIQASEVAAGAVVEKVTIKNDISFPAIVVGEEGRGRQRGIVPVSLSPADYEIYQGKGRVTIFHATITQTKSGKPKLQQTAESTDTAAIIVSRTPIGYRGGNSHKGDRFHHEGFTLSEDILVSDKTAPIQNCLYNADNRHWSAYSKQIGLNEIWYPIKEKARILEIIKERGAEAFSFGKEEEDVEKLLENPAGIFTPKTKTFFQDWPLEDLVIGQIAQGMAGAMGAGEQKVSIAKPGDIWRVGFSGRLYGSPDHYYYYYDGSTIMGGVTRDERDASELF